MDQIDTRTYHDFTIYKIYFCEDCIFKRGNYMRRPCADLFEMQYIQMIVEAEETLKLIASRLAQKWQEPYSRTFGYMKSRLAITILRATHRCIWGGGGVTAYRISVTQPQWEDGECLHLFW